MFNNVALDVFIGLAFIYLLYSLLASIIMEFIAHYMHLRPRLLMKALRRMLEDNPPEIFGIKSHFTLIDLAGDIKESVKRYFLPFKNLHFLKRFYYHPTIKYLGESRSSSKPSYMHADNFSQTILQLFRGNNRDINISQIAAIEHYLFVEAGQILEDYNKYMHWIVNAPILEEFITKKNLSYDALIAKLQQLRNNPVRYRTRKLRIDELITHIQQLGSLEEVERFRLKLAPLLIQVKERKISADTLKHFQNLFIDAQKDLNKFRLSLENWFNETMERTTGWYKRQTQVILLCLGFGIAVYANVDTLKIYKLLAKDKKVREQMVNMAVQSQAKYAAGIDSIRQRSKTDTIKSVAGKDSIRIQTKVLTTGDSVIDATYKLLQQDIANAENILGLGWCSSDSCKAYLKQEERLDSLKQELSFLQSKIENKKDSMLLAREAEIDHLSAGIKDGFKRYRNRWDGWSVMGWLITALAISLGAPFWFDLLNKLVKLRSAGTKVTESNKGTAATTNPQNPAPLTIHVNSNPGEEAVG